MSQKEQRGTGYAQLRVFSVGPVDQIVEAGAGIALATRQGPRHDNQDRAFVALIPSDGSSDTITLMAAVLDGMGGMEGGGEAATLGAATILNAVVANVSDGIKERLSSGISAANAAIHRRLRGRGGTTLTALGLTQDGAAVIVHAGDSRAYRYSGGRMEQFTIDDTLSGLLGSDAAQSLDPGLMQFVGIGRRFTAQAYRVLDSVDDTIILTTDGAHMIGDDLLNRACAKWRRPYDIAAAILAAAQDAQTTDNATVVVIQPSVAFVQGDGLSGDTVILWTPSAGAHLVELR